MTVNRTAKPVVVGVDGSAAAIAATNWGTEEAVIRTRRCAW